MYSKIFILILVILMGAVCATADTLTGKIVDGESNAPLAAANVRLVEVNKVVPTDGEGFFSFKKVEDGSYTLHISYIGYEKKKQIISFPFEDELVISLNPKAFVNDEIVVTGTRAEWRETPIVFTNISKETIRDKNYGQDIPMLLDEVPNVFSYSESGNGIGYTYLKVRGFDQKRVGVMINGVPLNDPEDHQVYWVNMPDFAESVDDIQLQRGVGSSLYGVSTFGGSLNMITNSFREPEKVETYSNYGSYNTFKYGARFTYNLMENYKLNLRYSRIESDGYRDNSASELWAVYGSLSRLGEKSTTELNIYTGKEISHAAWYASPEREIKDNRKHNPITYDNEIDEFSQPHFELHNTYFLSDKINFKNTLFYIRGKGKYEQYKYEKDLWGYGLVAVEDSLESDLIQEKWVTKNQFGWIGQANYHHNNGNLTLGSYLSLFDSEHWGEVDWLQLDSNHNEDFEYYNYTGDKNYVTFYLNENYKLLPNLNLMANLYYQHINYKMEQHEVGNFVGEYLNTCEVDYDFFNPRFGLNYNIDDQFNVFGNFSMSQREPTDDELFDTWDGADDLGVTPLFNKSTVIYDGDGNIKKVEWSDPAVKPEKLKDYELGMGYTSNLLNLQANLFWMQFENEIVDLGGVNDEGSPIRGNADETVHRGIELSLNSTLPANLSFSGSFAYNDNYFKEFKQYDWDGGYEDFSDKAIAGFPDVLANARLTYKNYGFTLSGHLQHVGTQYLDNTEDDDRTIPSYQVVNTYLIYRIEDFSDMADIEINFRINNLLDEDYYTAGYYDAWGGGNSYWVGAERNFMAGIRLGF